MCSACRPTGPDRANSGSLLLVVGAVAVSFPRLGIAIIRGEDVPTAALRRRRGTVGLSLLGEEIVIDHQYCVTDNQYDEDDDEITPDLWQEACWIVIRSVCHHCHRCCQLSLKGGQS